MANDLKILREFVELDSETTTNLRLNEATYYGKDKLLLACEDEIQKIMNKVRKNPSSFLNGECDPHFKKIEGLIKRRFNFEHVSFNTGTASIILAAKDRRSIGSDGYTYPNSMLVKYQKNKDGKRCAVVLDKNGKMKLRDGSGMSFTTYIAGSNFYDYGKEYTLTAEELMAILMHEIGHNFYYGPIREFTGSLLLYINFKDIETNGLCATIIDGLCQMLGGNIGLSLYSWLDTIPGIKEFMGYVRRYMAFGSLVVTEYINLRHILMLPKRIRDMMYGLKNVAAAVVDAPRSLIAYDEEKFSDAFAAAHGYGPALSSGLDKISRSKLLINQSDNKVLNIINDNLFALYQLVALYPIISILDCHPDTVGRGKNNIKYLEECSKNITNPKLRIEYNKDIERLKQQREQMRKYEGPNFLDIANKFSVIAQDITNLSDVKDLTSSFRGSNRTWSTLDVGK